MSRKSASQLRKQAARDTRNGRPRRLEHLGAPREEHCVCGKVAAYSEREATALALFYFSTRGGEAPRRVYECTAVGSTPGTWHWTRLA